MGTPQATALKTEPPNTDGGAGSLGRPVRRGDRALYNGRWVSARWYDRYIHPIFPRRTPKPRKPYKKRVSRKERDAQERAALKIELDKLVDSGLLYRTPDGAYGLAAWLKDDLGTTDAVSSPNNLGEPRSPEQDTKQ